ncbi:hypothetical protein [Olleya namhaensis]|jgi:hypothetical protein|uniref:Uncharacterized protein n=1 Tax=Olleya namhaensis TaxID=1144750 RepID=A0A1I3M5X2_9FLAO|nr:hypothetical protein [Olleya namhaensis]SFI92230.1 hypothetical protein SAMN05443431_10313 [Olleya namhaensis]
MAKIYSEHSNTPKKQNFKIEPKAETISFILNYSKALSVINYKNLKFEALQN